MSSRHEPTFNAPAEKWQEYLRGTGHVPETEPKPFGNYRAFHGFWVPPRTGLDPDAEPARPAKRAPRRRVQRPEAPEPATVTLARRNASLVAEQRSKLELAVEAGLINRDEAERELAAWMREQGLGGAGNAPGT